MNSKPVLSSLAELETAQASIHLAIGMFDGVHLGHAKVVGSAIETARSVDGLAAVLTFPEHPSRLLRPEAPTPVIMSPETKAKHLLNLGVDHVVLQTFDESFSKIEADVFTSHLKDSAPSLKSIHVGKNFRFGRGRTGDVDLLAIAATKLSIELKISDPVQLEDEPISSSRIREALAQGAISSVNEMLGRHHTASGRIQQGDGRGAEMGFPTLNLPWQPEAKPRYGVYAVRLTSTHSEQSWPGVANYGVRPTFGKEEDAPVLETHLFGDVPEVKAGDDVRVHFHSFLREERKFDSAEALKGQIAKDKESARQALPE